MRILFTLRDMNNEQIENFPEANIDALKANLQNPFPEFIHITLDGRELLLNKRDIMKIEFSVR